MDTLYVCRNTGPWNIPHLLDPLLIITVSISDVKNSTCEESSNLLYDPANPLDDDVSRFICLDISSETIPKHRCNHNS